jgi:peptidoglycan/xylan/chitin deacetylase (PgdA/CDA1 family)
VNRLTQLKYDVKKWRHRNSPLILCYHGICEQRKGLPLFTKISTDLFDAQIQFLVENFNCISLKKLKENIKKNRVEPHSIILTFDDGFANNYSVAVPTLKKYNVDATVFVSSGLLDTPNFIWNDLIPIMLEKTSRLKLIYKGKGIPIKILQEKEYARNVIISDLKLKNKKDIQDVIDDLKKQLDINDEVLFGDSELHACYGMLSRKQVKEMHLSGLIEIGSHGMNHYILSRLSEEEAWFEVAASKKLLEKIIGEKVTSYAYPNGTVNDFSEVHRTLLVKAGYDTALTTIAARVPQKADLLQLPRYCVPGNIDIFGFKYLLTY